MTIARSLRLPSYLILGLTAIQPVVDLGLRSAPFRIHSPAWRLALVANGSVVVGTALLMLLLILLIAVAGEDRGVAYAVSSLSALFAGLSVVAAGAFALDALQMKGQVQSAVGDRYDAASIWVIARMIIAAVLFVILSVNAMRAAKSIRFVPDRSPARNPVLINTPPRAAQAPPVATPSVQGKPIDG